MLDLDAFEDEILDDLPKEMSELMDLTFDLVIEKGYPADGWVLQRSDDEYVAWVYVMLGDEQVSVFEEVESASTPYDSARLCYLSAYHLPEASEGSSEDSYPTLLN